MQALGEQAVFRGPSAALGDEKSSLQTSRQSCHWVSEGKRCVSDWLPNQPRGVGHGHLKRNGSVPHPEQPTSQQGLGEPMAAEAQVCEAFAQKAVRGMGL